MGRRLRIRVARERFKFSCAHMTVFPDGTKERLHGHNYTLAVALDLVDGRFERMVDFARVKAVCAAICDGWRERTLIAGDNPYLVLSPASGDELELSLCGKRYVFPREDVLVLPIVNTAVEDLASHAADLVVARLGPVLPAGSVTAVEVTVEETPGQGATCLLKL
ncbi:MAG TPA: 6-carboxytetrahydropterin synthase [Kofleriaceae bacterium]|nr:6-carboxytetrahydropterin synthase [Kofleriaceae bacterium]